MAIPLSPDPALAYWGVDPTAPPPQDNGQVPAYWGGDAVAPTGDPFGAGAAAAGIAPPQQVAPAAPAIAADPFAAGAAKAGIAAPAEKVYNDFIPAGAGPASLGKMSLVDPPRPVPGAPIAGAAPPPATAPAITPTAAENAELAALTAKLNAKKPSVGGPGAPANPDPYGIGAAQKAQLGAMDARMDAMGRAANAEQDRDFKRAEHNANLARMQQEDVAIARSEQEYAAKHFNEQMTEIGRQLDDVRSRKVDPLKDFKESPALGALAVVGGIVGGLYQGLTNGQHNQFLVDMEHHIDRGIAEQERQIREEKYAIGEGINLLHQQRQAHKDDAIAAAQMRNLTYEALKNEINAEADRDGTEIGRANADAAIQIVKGQQAELMRQIGEQKRAAAAAAAAQAHAQRKEVQTAIFTQYEKNLASGMSPGQAVDWAQYMIGQVYAPGHGPARPAEDPGHGGMMTKEQRGKVAMEHQEAQFGADEFNKQMDALKRHPALDNLGLTTGALSHLGQRMAPGSAATVQDLMGINTQVLQAVGKVAKDADGKPNKAMIEKLEERFEIHPTDTKEMAIQKLEGAREAVNALSRQQGATNAPMPGAQRDIAASLGAKPVGR